MTDAGDGGAFEQEVFAALDELYAFRLSIVEHTDHVDDRGRGDRPSRPAVDRRLLQRRHRDGQPAAGSRRAPCRFVPDADRRRVDPSGRPIVRARVGQAGRRVRPRGGRRRRRLPLARCRETHEVDTRRPVDRAEVDRVADKYLQAGRLNTVVLMIQAYPAEASSGTIFVQLGDPSFVGRQGRWDLLSGFMHEYLHLVAHPGYNDAAETMGGGAGGCWSRASATTSASRRGTRLVPRFSTDDDLRRRVEGAAFFTADTGRECDRAAQHLRRDRECPPIVSDLDRRCRRADRSPSVRRVARRTRAPRTSWVTSSCSASARRQPATSRPAWRAPGRPTTPPTTTSTSWTVRGDGAGGA